MGEHSDVTRAAVVEGFEHFIGDAIEITLEEFSVTRALNNGIQGPGSSLVDNLVQNSARLRKNVIEPELKLFRDATFEQFGVILDYAESGADIEDYREVILDAGAFENSIREDASDEDRQAALDAMLSRHNRLGDAVKPLINSPEDSFWDAARRELTEEEADRLVEIHFAFTQPLRDHSDALQLDVRVKPTDVIGGFGLFLGPASITVDYTDEALRSLYEAEQAVIQIAKDDVERIFSD